MVVLIITSNDLLLNWKIYQKFLCDRWLLESNQLLCNICEWRVTSDMLCNLILIGYWILLNAISTKYQLIEKPANHQQIFWRHENENHRKCLHAHQTIQNMAKESFYRLAIWKRFTHAWPLLFVHSHSLDYLLLIIGYSTYYILSYTS